MKVSSDSTLQSITDSFSMSSTMKLMGSRSDDSLPGPQTSKGLSRLVWPIIASLLVVSMIMLISTYGIPTGALYRGAGARDSVTVSMEQAGRHQQILRQNPPGPDLENGCSIMCTADYAPVCGSDGFTYSNACRLGVAACLSGRPISVEHQGECQSGRPGLGRRSPGDPIPLDGDVRFGH